MTPVFYNLLTRHVSCRGCGGQTSTSVLYGSYRVGHSAYRYEPASRPLYAVEVKQEAQREITEACAACINLQQWEPVPDLKEPLRAPKVDVIDLEALGLI